MSGPPEAQPAGAGAAALRFLAARERHLASGGEVVAPDPARVAAGWQPRFVAQGARLEEMSRLYTELGYEVAADAVRPQDVASDCRDCRVRIGLEFRMIYTRRRDGLTRPGRSAP